MTSTNNRDKVKTYLLAASGRRTIRNAPWIDDVPSESFTLPKYEVSGIFIAKSMRIEVIDAFLPALFRSSLGRST